MSVGLDRLCGPDGPLIAELFDRQELAGVVRSGIARLHDAGNDALATESRFDLA